MSNVEDEQVVHEYDGIREPHNFLRRRWPLLLYLAITFGVVYMIIFHVGGRGMSSAKKHEAATEVATPVGAIVVEKTGPATDVPTLAQGQGLFATYCAACHTPTGGGLVGPNLTDAYWLHGASYADSVHVVTKGVPEKGMISWAPILKKDEIDAVCSYVFTLRGTNPSNAKNPEGEEVPGSDDPVYGVGAAEDGRPEETALEPDVGG